MEAKYDSMSGGSHGLTTKGLSPVRKSESHPTGQGHSPDQQGAITALVTPRHYWHGCRVAQCSPGFNQMWEIEKSARASTSCSCQSGRWKPLLQLLPALPQRAARSGEASQTDITCQRDPPKRRRIVLLTDPKP